MHLDVIQYSSVINFTKFFLEKFKEKDLKNLDMVISNVRKMCPYIMNMSYVFDETIWHPDNPELYKNLIEFKIQLANKLEYLPFRLMINEGFEQKAILLNSNFFWSK